MRASSVFLMNKKLPHVFRDDIRDQHLQVADSVPSLHIMWPVVVLHCATPPCLAQQPLYLDLLTVVVVAAGADADVLVVVVVVEALV